MGGIYRLSGGGVSFQDCFILNLNEANGTLTRRWVNTIYALVQAKISYI